MTLVPQKNGRLEASAFIRDEKTSILKEWVDRCRERVDAANSQGRTDLLDSLPDFMDQLVVTLGCPDPADQAEVNAEVAREHGEDRANQPEYTLDEMIYEYHILRACILGRLEKKGGFDMESRLLIHEFLDRGIRKAAVRFVEIHNKRMANQKIENDQLREQLLVATRASVKRLEEERELRERFVDTLTHDLRTPLTAARIAAQFLGRKAGDPEAVISLGTRIMASVDRADRMIRDLLDANGIKAGEGIPVTFAECDLAKIVDEAIAELRPMTGWTFAVRKRETEIRGHWDFEGLRRIVQNLVGNAMKYGTAPGVVTITIGHDEKFATMSVHNPGAPISQEDQKNIFVPYRRTESAIRSGQKGWGIGLALVRALVEAHHGEVRVESFEGIGTTFTVRLPLERIEGT